MLRFIGPKKSGIDFTFAYLVWYLVDEHFYDASNLVLCPDKRRVMQLMMMMLTLRVLYHGVITGNLHNNITSSTFTQF